MLSRRGLLRTHLGRRRRRGARHRRQHRARGCAGLGLRRPLRRRARQGVPINKSARAAGVVAAGDQRRRTASTVAYGDREVVLTRADLRAMPQTHRRRCRSPASRAGAPAATWTGVRVRDLLDLVDAPAGQRRARRRRCRSAAPFRATTLPGNFADDPLTLLASASTASRWRSTTATRAG